jgi:hypothetical protein
MTDRRLLPVLATCILALPLVLLASACGGDDTPDASQYQADGSKTGAGAAAETAPPAPPRPTLATSATGWQGLEARLVRFERVSNMLSVEVELVNVGGSRVPIQNYSAAGAQVTDEATRQTFGVFERTGMVVASTDVNQDLDPGESTTINAVFPVPGSASSMTLTLPNIEPFASIAVPGRSGQEPKTTPRGLRNAQPGKPPAPAKPAPGR